MGNTAYGIGDGMEFGSDWIGRTFWVESWQRNVHIFNRFVRSVWYRCWFRTSTITSGNRSDVRVNSPDLVCVWRDSVPWSSSVGNVRARHPNGRVGEGIGWVVMVTNRPNM